MSKKLYESGPIMDLPRITENEHLFISKMDEEEEKEFTYKRNKKMAVKTSVEGDD